MNIFKKKKVILSFYNIAVNNLIKTACINTAEKKMYTINKLYYYIEIE